VRLEIELIPRPLWGMSVAKQDKRLWSRVRVGAYSTAGHRCEVCGETGPRGSNANPGGLEAHEQWEYVREGATGIQRLVKVLALCPRCHRCKHMGRSKRTLPREQFRELEAHFMTVNGMSRRGYEDHVGDVMRAWPHHIAVTWIQDLSILNAIRPHPIKTQNLE
jgi:hypothetical protein